MEMPLPQPDPFTPNKDNCSCAKKKKKKKKKSKPRDVCYRGTYRQLKKGISYVKQEEVPCDDKAPKRARKTTSRKKPPNVGDLARDIFGI